MSLTHEHRDKRASLKMLKLLILKAALSETLPMAQPHFLNNSSRTQSYRGLFSLHHYSTGMPCIRFLGMLSYLKQLKGTKSKY